MPKKKNSILVFDKTSDIINYLDDKSETMINYINNNLNSKYTLIRKFITHSDIPTYWKRCWDEQKLDKNFLYYLSFAEMQEIESRENNKFETAKQSNIWVPSIFYDKLGIEKIERRKWKQTEQHKHPIINDYLDVNIVNDTIKYFSIDYTFKVFEKLEKQVKWPKNDFEIKKEWLFTPIKLSFAVHGIWTSDDKEFHKLRKNIFKNDTLILLIEETPDWTKKLFILLDKNPKFFSIINETNKAYEKFLLKEKQFSEKITHEMVDIIETEKTRKFQSLWRTRLAEEMMIYTTEDEKIFCPLTLIEGDFSTVWTLYRASHIKPYSECDVIDAFDIDNWLLLVANADALFDKHLISIDKDKNLIFSFVIKNEHQLINKLLLNQPIFKTILNDNRMKFIESHRETFYKKEEERKIS